MGLMRERSRIDRNSPDAILMSYDLQSGSYTTLMDDPEHCAMKKRVNDSIADVLRPLGAGSRLEVGVGEASTLAGVISALGIPPAKVAGFDISWSCPLEHTCRTYEWKPGETIITRTVLDILASVLPGACSFELGMYSPLTLSACRFWMQATWYMVIAFCLGR